MVLDTWTLSVLPHSHVLKRTVDAATGLAVYHLRAPCPAAMAERVHPWWEMGAEVLVCPDSHLPDRFVFDPGTGPATAISCNGSLARPAKDPGGRCGCGPNLMRCVRDQAHRESLDASLMAELVDTFARVVSEDRPVAEAFTMNATVRDRDAEFVYRRALVEAGEPASFADLPAWTTRLAPRQLEPPGRHAGLLTAAATFDFATRRERVNFYYEKLWCVEAQSTGVTAEQIVKLGSPDLRVGDGWKQLAAMPICTSCHARIDYGMQFFAGFADSRFRHHFDRQEQGVGPGNLYFEDIHDSRGTAPLNAQGFATLAVGQPEFRDCMVRRVGQFVFGSAFGEDQRAALRTAFDRRGSLKDVFREALLRVARQRPAPLIAPAATANRVPPAQGEAPGALLPPGAATELVPLPETLRDALATHCSACHLSGTREPSLDHLALPRPTLERALEQVAFRQMPKDLELPADEREALVTALVRLLRPAEEREEAERYYRDGFKAAPLMPPEVAFTSARAGAGGGKARRWALLGMAHYGNWPWDIFQYTPGVGAALSLEALDACKRGGRTGAALDRCLDEGLSPERALRGPMAITAGAPRR